MVRTAGIPNLTQEDKFLVLNAVELVLPVGGNEWDLVATQYNNIHAAAAKKDKRPVVVRPAAFLKRVYDELAFKKKPTGESTLSDLIRKAKSIESDIQDKINHVTGGATDNEEESDFGSDDDYDEQSSLPSPSLSGLSLPGPSSAGPSSSSGSSSLPVPSKKALGKRPETTNSFRGIGEALGDDMPSFPSRTVGDGAPTRSRTTPVSRFEKKQSQGAADAAFIRLVDFMTKGGNEQPSLGGESDGAVALSRVDTLERKIDTFMEQIALLVATKERPEKEDDEGSNKRQRRE
ncbi:unnamed protein product [Mucor hiemalis]